MASAGKATASEFQLPVRSFHLRDSNNRFHDMFPRDGLSIAILRGLIETWKEKIDRNLSWFNQLVFCCRSDPAVWLAWNADIPLTPALSPWERGQREREPVRLPLMRRCNDGRYA